MFTRAWALGLVLGLGSNTWGATLTVNASGTGAYVTIQAAICAAISGDVVVLQPGTYTGGGNRDIDFGGKAITVRSSNPDDPGVIATTVIDCQNAGRGFLFAGNETGTSVLEGVTVVNGHTSGDGGGIVCQGASPTIRKCRILTCSAGTATMIGAGGGLSLDTTSASVSQCVITGNSAFMGGGVYCGGGSARLTDCVIAGNSTIATSGSGNSYGGGAGLCLVLDGTILTNCTIVNNSSVHNRGGLYTFLTSSPATIRNCILWGNAGTQIDGVGMAVSYSDVQGGYSGTGNLNSNPNLTADYHLPATSPCVGTGDPAFVPASGETDIDWQPRVISGRVDMGSDEFTWVGDINGDNHVNASDLLSLVSAWGAKRGSGIYNPRCDLNNDGAVDVVDLLMLADNWGK